MIESHFVPRDDSNFQSTGLYRLELKWLSGVIKFVTGKRIYDVTSGFRTCNRSTIKFFSKEYPIDYPKPESIVSTIKHLLAVAKVRAKINECQGGASSIRTYFRMYYIMKASLVILIQDSTQYDYIKEREYACNSF